MANETSLQSSNHLIDPLFNCNLSSPTWRRPFCLDTQRHCSIWCIFPCCFHQCQLVGCRLRSSLGCHLPNNSHLVGWQSIRSWIQAQKTSELCINRLRNQSSHGRKPWWSGPCRENALKNLFFKNKFLFVIFCHFKSRTVPEPKKARLLKTLGLEIASSWSQTGPSVDHLLTKRIYWVKPISRPSSSIGWSFVLLENTPLRNMSAIATVLHFRKNGSTCPQRLWPPRAGFIEFFLVVEFQSAL